MCGTVFFDLFVVHTSIFPHHFDQATRPEMFLIECAAKYREGVPIWEYGKTEELEEASRDLRYLQLVISLNFVSCVFCGSTKVVLGVNFDIPLSWEFFSQFELHN